jgi:hypothetical protein
LLPPRGQTLYLCETFKDLAGTRVAAEWANPEEAPEGVFALAVREGGKLRVMLHKGRQFGSELPVEVDLTDGARLVTVQSIRWEGPMPARIDPKPADRHASACPTVAV